MYKKNDDKNDVKSDIELRLLLLPPFCQTITMNKIRNPETKNQDSKKIANTTQLDICDYYKINHPSTIVPSIQLNYSLL